MDIRYLFIFFPLAITLHNIEEALWLPKWSKIAKKYHQPVGESEFRFAVIIVTMLAYIVTFMATVYYNNSIVLYIYFGFLGAMIINAVFPHLIATIVLRKYTPGLITGLFLNVPINSIIIYLSIQQGLIEFNYVILASIIVGLLLLSLLPILFRLGKSLLSYN